MSMRHCDLEKDLKNTTNALGADRKGLLAMDESNPNATNASRSWAFR
jgi:hypothetical protein